MGPRWRAPTRQPARCCRSTSAAGPSRCPRTSPSAAARPAPSAAACDSTRRTAPRGDAGYGTITVIDPGGQPFKGPPDPVAGGVFAGGVTNRSAASTHGLTAPALATALLTKSPDGTGRAVFLAAVADGSVVQVHVQKGVDGMAPPASFTPLAGITSAAAESTDPDAVTRVGMVFNWVPSKVVYVTDPLANRILALDLSDDGTLFTATPRYIASRWLDRPIDAAPTSV